MRLLAILFLLLATHAGAARVQEARPLMGTAVEVIAEGAEAPPLHAAVQAAFAEMQRLADMMSHYDPRSVVSAINGAAGARWVPVPPELAEVLAQARRVSERTGGAFDITVGGSPIDYRKLHLEKRGQTPFPSPALAEKGSDPFFRAFLEKRGMRLDLGGIAKLYILEAGLRRLKSAGVARALVNGGGDVLAHSSGAPWRVGVRDPRAPTRLLGRVLVVRGAVASSGDYERPGHVIDPRSGRPARGVRGVTLVGPVEAVNGLGPAIMVLGAEAGKALMAAAKVEGLIADAEGGLWVSPGLELRQP